MLSAIEVEEYRSVRRMRLRLSRLNVLTGPNGCGKSNLYNALHLLARAAQGRFARAVAEEGGMGSMMWAGGERDKRLTRKRGPVRLKLGFESSEFHYRFEAGYPAPGSLPIGTVFDQGIEVKEESLAPASGPRVLLLERRGPTAWLRDEEGRRREYAFQLQHNESALSQIVEPKSYPEIALLRHEIVSWRFYHHFRTDAGSPLRQDDVRVQTTVIGQDGEGLASALRTVQEIGDDAALARAVSDAFRGAELRLVPDRNLLRLQLAVPGILRPLDARELSDGQLRFLCLCAALLSPRQPPLLALNEPESSLHPDLLPPLARLIHTAARTTQLWITTHSPVLAEEIERLSGIERIRLAIQDGETVLNQ
ncbi:MAG: DUF2813 domain-containing protein [Acidobacteria bacterium]|nr:DUF2813 domain-containing protein [Acidobacteriota bacterium]